jgi:hypothetical protein
MVLAVATPTRSPLNSPGPTSTAMAPSSPSSTPAWWQVNSMAGTRVSTCRRRRAAWNEASTPSWPPMAQPTWMVELSIPRISIGPRSLLDQPAGEGAPEG